MTDAKGTGEVEPAVEDEQRRQESLKLLYDWFKPLTTLSTGSILIAGGLVKTIFPDPDWPGVFAVGIVLVAISLAAAMTSMMGVILDVRKPYTGPGTNKASEQRTFMRSFTVAWGCFLSGLALFVAFALKNGVF